jgi:hypothetical protein
MARAALMAARVKHSSTVAPREACRRGDLAVWSRQLSTQEIKAIYSAGESIGELCKLQLRVIQSAAR